MRVKITRVLNGIRFQMRVVPKSSKNIISIMDEGVIKLKINAPPVDGKANQSCIKYLSGVFNVSKSQISIISGQKSKNKVVEIQGDADVLIEALDKKLADID